MQCGKKESGMLYPADLVTYHTDILQLKKGLSDNEIQLPLTSVKIVIRAHVPIYMTRISQ